MFWVIVYVIKTDLRLGFKEKDDLKGFKGNSVENESARHSRTNSDGNNSYGPPNGKKLEILSR
jgi:hypothetical protein